MRSREYRRSLVTGMVAAMTLAGSARAQQPAAGDPLGQQLTALRQALAANQQALLHYAWIETTQMSYQGEVKSVQQMQCEYGPDGKVVKSPLATMPEDQSKPHGPLRRHIVDKKTAEIADYMDSVKVLTAEYVPPQPTRLQLAYQAGNASLSESPATGMVALAFKNYAQAGDALTLTFNDATKKMSSVNVNTWYKDPKGVVTLSVQFATLPDGTSYPNQSVLVAEAESVQIQITNSDYASQAAP